MPVIVAGWLGIFGWAVPAKAATVDWEIKKDDKVITMFETPLREDSRILTVISAGTELTVTDVQGDFVSTATTSGSTTVKGWVYARHLRTPAMLKKLKAVSDEFKDYKLWEKAFPTLPETVAFRRLGRPMPPSDLSVSSVGKASVQAVVDASDTRRESAASSLDTYLKQYMMERNWPRKFDSSSAWQILVAWDHVSVEVADKRAYVVESGNLFVINTESKTLIYQRPIVGEGMTEDEIFRDFAKQAGSEYSEIMLRWATAPTIPAATTTTITTTTTAPPTTTTTTPPATTQTTKPTTTTTTVSPSTPPEPKRPPYGPPRPPFFRPPY
jgi:hypothetical protein